MAAKEAAYVRSQVGVTGEDIANSVIDHWQRINSRQAATADRPTPKIPV